MKKHDYPFDCSVKAMAERVGISKRYLQKTLKNGCKNPEIAKAIQRETEGAIKASYLLGLEEK